MARQNASTRLTLKLQTGFNDEKGIPVTKSYSFSGISSSASDPALHSLAAKLAALSSYPLHDVVRTDTASIGD